MIIRMEIPDQKISSKLSEILNNKDNRHSINMIGFKIIPKNVNLHLTFNI